MALTLPTLPRSVTSPHATPSAPSAPSTPPTRRRKFLFAAGALLITVSLAAALTQRTNPADRASLEEMRDQLQSGRAIVFDIREPDEHATGVAPGARLLPMSQLRQRLRELPTDPSQPVLLVCRTQNRSGATLRALRDLGGYGHVRFVDSGMSEWARRGWPMVKP